MFRNYLIYNRRLKKFYSSLPAFISFSTSTLFNSLLYLASIISDNAYFFNTRGIFSRFSNHNLLLRLMVFPDSRFSKSVPFIFVLISDIPLISCKMWLHSFCILPRLPIEEVFSFPIHGQAPQSSLEARFLVCRILFLFLSSVFSIAPVSQDSSCQVGQCLKYKANRLVLAFLQAFYIADVQNFFQTACLCRYFLKVHYHTAKSICTIS